MPSEYGRRGGVHHARPVPGCPTDTARAPEAFPGRSAGAGVLSPGTGGIQQQGPLMLLLLPSLLRSQTPQKVACGTRGDDGVGTAVIESMRELRELDHLDVGEAARIRVVGANCVAI